MKYKFIYQDSQGQQHKRYYNALNATTATEMFKASIDHSFGDKEIKILEIYKLSPEDGGWVSGNMHITDTSYISSLK